MNATTFISFLNLCSESDENVNPAQVTSAQFGQTVLLLKLKIS